MLRGHLKFENPPSTQIGERVIIFVEDTSRSDADGISVAQTIAKLPTDFDFEHGLLPFEIELDDEVDTLTIRAHMPCHSGSDVQLGDMITMESIPARSGTDIAVTLRRVD